MLAPTSLLRIFTRQFHEWYACQIFDQIQKETPPQSVDLRITAIKPLGAQWMMINLHDCFKSKPEVVRNGFKAGGIVNSLSYKQ